MDTNSTSTDSIRAVATGSIVVGTDGSYDADECVAWAAERAGLEKRPLTILYAADSGAAYRHVFEADDAVDHRTMIRDFEKNAQQLVEDTAERARRLQPGLEVRAHYSTADARHALLEASEHATLLIVGSRGRGPIGSLLLGSVSAAVSRHAACPVVVLRPGAANHRGDIVVGVDGRPESEPVIEMAFREASLRGRRLKAVHTHFDQIAFAYGLHGLSDPAHSSEQSRQLADAVEGFTDKFPEVEVARVVRVEDVGHALLDADPEASMIVVGRHHHHGPLAALHRGVASTIIEHANTSVAVVPIP